MKKTFFLSLILIFACVLIWLFWPFFPEKLSEITTAQPKIINQLEKEVFAPSPLTVIEEIKNYQAFLYQEEVINQTNIEREKYGLLPLQENIKLNNMAKAKVDDMFAYQYFAHQSPLGKEAKDLAVDFSYEFLSMGENLAMGNFENEEKLVQEWMNSLGHRENILNPVYQEIGVALKKGEFEGVIVWLAVQHFGLPSTACPQPDDIIKQEIMEKQEELEQLEDSLFSLRMELQKIKPKWSKAYQEKAEEYNDLAEKYNKLLLEYKSLVEQYNKEVEEFNQCFEIR